MSNDVILMTPTTHAVVQAFMNNSDRDRRRIKREIRKAVDKMKAESQKAN